MRTKLTSMATCCCCMTALLHAQAQTDRAPRQSREFVVFAGIAQSEQLNATASPLTFRGRGYDAAASYERLLRGGRLTFVVSFDGGVRRVSTTDAAATERVMDASVRAALLREFTSGSGGRSVGAGLAVATNFTTTTHRYADPTRSVADFFAGFMTVGPAASWRERIGGGAVVARLATPLIGLVDHPYSDSRSNYSPTTIRVATVRSLRGLNGAITYAPAERRHVGIVYGYHFALLDYADVQPLRAASQSLSVGIATRFGGRAE